MLIAGSEAAANHRLRQDIDRLGKALAYCRPCHPWTPAAIAAKAFDMHANSGIMRATSILSLEMPSPESVAKDWFE